jgi:hypothetical protein
MHAMLSQALHLTTQCTDLRALKPLLAQRYAHPHTHGYKHTSQVTPNIVIALVVLVLTAVFISQRNIALELRSAYAKLSDTNLLALLSDSAGSMSPKRGSVAVARRSRGASVAPVMLALSKADGHSSSMRARQLTSPASAKSYRRANSMSSRSRSASNVNTLSLSMSAYDEGATAVTGAASQLLSPTVASFSSTSSSPHCAPVGDVEAGMPVMAVECAGVRSGLSHSLSDIPLSDAKLPPHSNNSGEWVLRTLREESSSAYISVSASVK